MKNILRVVWSTSGYLGNLKGKHTSLCVKKKKQQLFGVPTSSDTNQAVQSQKQLICAFGFAYAYCWFSDALAHIFMGLLGNMSKVNN